MVQKTAGDRCQAYVVNWNYVHKMNCTELKAYMYNTIRLCISKNSKYIKTCSPNSSKCLTVYALQSIVDKNQFNEIIKMTMMSTPLMNVCKLVTTTVCTSDFVLWYNKLSALTYFKCLLLFVKIETQKSFSDSKKLKADFIVPAH